MTAALDSSSSQPCESPLAPIEDRSAWTSASLGEKSGFTIELESRHVHALESAANAIAPDDDPFDAVDRDGFGLDSIAREVQSWRDEVHHGRGFVLLRGFPVETWSRSVLERAYYGLGSHFGHAVSQSTIGDRLGHVLNVGDLDGRERAYRNRRGLKLHTDRCDVIGMLCVRPALRGGVSGYASAAAIFNAMLAECPEHLGPLFEGYQYHRFGEQADGDPDYTRSKVPIFSLRDGALSVVYLRAYMEMAAHEMGRELPGALVEALDRFESVSNREDIRLDFLLEPGEAIFFSNCTMLHTRTEFEDASDPARRRHLLRLWLMAPGVRPAVDSVLEYKLGAATEGGIRPKAAPSTYYSGQAYEAVNRS